MFEPIDNYRYRATLVFYPSPGEWEEGEIPVIADVLSMIACELLKGEHRTTTRIELGDRAVGF